MRQQSELMLRATIEGVPEMIAVQDTSARYIAFSRAYHAEFKKIFGIDLKIGDSMIEVLADLPVEQQVAAELLDRTMRGEDFVTTHEFGDRRRERRFYEIHCFPLYDEQGNLLGGTHVARDVTEVKLLKEAMSISEENSRRIIESSPHCIKCLDLEGRVLSINPEGQFLMELDKVNQYVGEMWLESWQGEHRALAAAALHQAMSGKIGRFRAAGRTLKGNQKWWDETIVPLMDANGRPERLMVLAQDITEQKKIEDGLRRSEEEFRTFFESASGGKAQTSPYDGRFLRVNGMLCEMTGYSEAELLAMTFIDVLHPEDREWQMELFRRNRDSQAPEYSVEKRYLRKDGSTLWVQVTVGFLRDETGKAYRCFAVVQDITESKRTQAALLQAMEQAEESRRLLEALLEYVPEGIAIADGPDLRVRMMSRYGQKFYPRKDQLTAEDVTGECRLFHSDGVTPFKSDELPLVRAVRQNEIIKDVEIVHVDENGQRQWLRCNAGPIHDATGKVLGGIAAWHEVTERRQAEEAFKNERGFLRQVIDAAPSMIFVKDWDGRFVLANQALANCYGTTIEDVVGKTDADFNPNTDELEHFLQDDREVMSRCKEKLIPEEKVTFANGEVHWFNTIKVPLIGPDGGCKRLLGVASDITQRKNVEAALKRFRIALDSSADNIFIIDPETMRFQDVSQSACRDLYYSRDELLGMGPADIMPHVSIDELRRRFAEIRSDPAGKGVIETVHYRKDCAGFEVEVMLRPVEDEGRPLLVAVARDITERKQNEARMKRVNEQLAEADQRKDEFLAMLAHELRNPLAPIRNAVQVLRLALRQEPILQRQREIIDRQVTHMARLLDDLLDVSRITRGKITLKQEVLNLSDVFARAVESANPLIEARRHTLAIVPPPEGILVYGDFDRLIQIIGNLLNNAAKYTEEGGNIWLEARREDGEMAISVRDTGMGIAPEMLPKIFDVFTQATRSLDRAQGGLGLGLTLVRNLTELHGGRIEAKSAGLGKGSEFIVHLPILPEGPVPEAKLEHVPTEAKSHRRILVVDDVADTANSLAELLGMIGHEVRTAFDGSTVVKIAREFRPHVILLDIGLPGENGYEVARQIRRDPLLKDTVLVALTGYGQDDDRRLAEEAGFDHLFTKPVELGALEPYLA